MSAEAEMSISAAPNEAQHNGNSQAEFSTDLLKVYYGRLFPYDLMFNWLSYGNDPSKATTNKAIDKEFFSHREWSFTINEAYLRYLSFSNKEEMIAAIQKRQPHKIDIGAVFTHCPKEHTTINPESFHPVERELVFDIDISDYDDVRTCCTGADICHRCWPYMTMAMKVIDLALREDFDFQNILWIYSGRRGIHCWVCDPDARSLTNEARGAIVDYLSVNTGTNENSDKKIKQSFEQAHPMLRRAYAVLEPYFEANIADDAGQGLLAHSKRDATTLGGNSSKSQKKYMSVLNSLPNDYIRSELYDRWDRDDTLSGAARWRQIVAATTAPAQELTQAQQQALRKKRINYGELESWRYELVFTHCYARLDANVSKTQNHLLKSAFCVHPKTGRVCVPIDPRNADYFDPFAVPTVRSLCAEIDAYDKVHNEANEEEPATVADLEKTSLRQAVEVFNKCFWKPMWGSIHKEFRQKLDRMNALNVDF